MDSTLKNKIIYFDEVNSTQGLAKQYITEGKAQHGMVFIAQTQVQGIGRLNRSWSSPKGGLWMTTIYQKNSSLSLFQGFSVKLGLAIVNSLEKILQLNFQIKWPNDILLDGKKVGGILIDIISQDDFVKDLIVGIGLNVNFPVQDLPSNLIENSTTILDHLNEEISLEKIRDGILKSQNSLYEMITNNMDFENFSIWNEQSFTFNKRVVAHISDLEIIGKEVGITNDGDLILQLDDETKKIISTGEITLLREKKE
ncbi:MAG: biotin--[acetyl-CoA-carboxylase] ligase [Candidatus Thorarchaeota archaeon]